VSDPANAVTLSLRAPLAEPLDVDGVTADRVAGLSAREIADLPVWLGGRAARTGDFFDVKGERSATLRVQGALSQVHGLAAAMAGGSMVIDGDAGRRVAAGMTGGSVEVVGSVGDDAGLAMSGGVLRVSGNAGDRLGAAAPGASKGMTGGEIIVSGSAGSDAAARTRRGLVVVCGEIGADAARAMIAGTLVVFGRTGARPGRGSKRGSIVALGGIEVPVTYWFACTFEPPHVRLLLTYLRRRYGLTVADRMVSGRYRRYCGDAGNPGRGEILEWLDSSAFSGDVANGGRR
jgi:formylmethanofuran dehydrogenase subunit C